VNTNALKTFARDARLKLLDLVGRKIEFVLTHDTAELRGKREQIGKLRREIERHGKEQVIERIAYIWFNRFMALRFMDANEYNSPKVVSPIPGGTIPEILQEAKAGHIDESLQIDRQRVNDLLDGKTPSADPQTDAYKLLLVASCNALNAVMPFMFERIADYTELLMPDDLLSDYSIVTDIRNGMSDEDCKQVEIIGWMYQFYISEKKAKVFEDLAKNKKITPENIPAATQLFTPNWIVRYLVENSLGRLWMLNRPNSKLIEKMPYYIKPVQTETDFLKISTPEEIKLCDPACGSGHMLVYAFALLYLIYEEEGYEQAEIPGKILINNLYGVEIDERAGELAAFALTMVAREKHRRFFKKPVQPNICVLENIDFASAQDPRSSKRDLFTNVKWEDKGWEKILDELCKSGVRREALLHDINLFSEADNLGSLVTPKLSPQQLHAMMVAVKEMHRIPTQDAFLSILTEGVLKALNQAKYLSKQYHIVVANPPYMGGKGMNERLKKHAQDYYPDSKSDLFAMFIERGFNLIHPGCYNAMVTMQSWMFLSSYEKLRQKLADKTTIECMVHMANMVMGIAFGTAATVWHSCHKPLFKGHYSYVEYEDITSDNKPREFPIINDRLARASITDFKKIPGSPIAYWVSDKLRSIFNASSLEDVLIPKFGMSVGDGSRFIRYWFEVSYSHIGISCDHEEMFYNKNYKWCPLDKGGEYRKWYGNQYHVVWWKERGSEIKTHPSSAVRSPQYFFQPHYAWTLVSSGSFSVRYFPQGFILDTASNCFYFKENSKTIPWKILAFLNSKLCNYLMELLNPTINYSCGVVGKLPLVEIAGINEKMVETIVSIVASDSETNEISLTSKGWSNILVNTPLVDSSIKSTYEAQRLKQIATVNQVASFEEEMNHALIKSLDLPDNMFPPISLDEITLFCNPYHLYGKDHTNEELEAMFLLDTFKDFISFMVGCMFGRYSIDKPGIILANQGESLQDYLKQIPKPTFVPNEDNITLIQEDEYFSDDIVEQFKKILRVTFGSAKYEENIAFIEEAIGKEIRKYFMNDFYKDHFKRYKKRPIYWMFSSPKRSFNVLIYMHRYRPDTISTILNDYLRVFISKLESKKTTLNSVAISESASAREKTRATKDIDSIESKLKELKTYEQTLHDFAARKIELDLDDGVKVNYLKFKEILAPIPGLDRDEE